jgi:hypothetical protein
MVFAVTSALPPEVAHMRTTVAILSAGAFLTVFSLQVAAQAPSSPAPRENPAAQAQASQAPAGDAQKSETARGELKSVDSTKKTLTIKPETGADMVFMYNDDTKITGAQNGAAGLATMSGRQLTVHYTMKGTDRIASAVEVAAASAK